MVDFYLTTMRTGVSTQFQYRVANYFYMLGMVAEPVIYLVVWTTIADQSGGSVQGITAGEFAAYYIVWTLVRNMNIVFGAPFWEWRIREGELSGQLLRPLHPLHYDIAYFAGWKVVVIALWIPIGAALTLIFDPTFVFTAEKIVVFFIAIWGAYLIRTMFQSCIGMLCFWTTSGSGDLRPLDDDRAPAVRTARPADADAGLDADACELPPLQVDVLLPDSMPGR